MVACGRSGLQGLVLSGGTTWCGGHPHARACEIVGRQVKLPTKTVDFKELLRMEPDGGTTNIRNVKSKHWTRWLGVENRCVVPFNSFSEFNKAEGGDIWFALDETRPLACFAGIWTNWTSVRKVREDFATRRNMSLKLHYFSADGAFDIGDVSSANFASLKVEKVLVRDLRAGRYGRERTWTRAWGADPD
jgi:hypothetical protein